MAKIDRIALGDPSRTGRGTPASPALPTRLSVAGQSFLLNANGSNFGSCFVILDDFRRPPRPRNATTRPSPRSSASDSPREIDEAQVQVFRAPPIQGLGSGGGFKLQVEQRGFVDLDELQTARPTRWSRGRQTGSAAAGRVHHVPRRHAAALPRHRPHQVRVARRARAGRLQHAAGLHGRLLRQPVQRLRPHLAGQPAGRARVPHAGRQIQQLKVRNAAGRDGAAGHAVRSPRHRRAGHGHALQHVRLGAGHRQPGPGHQLRRGDQHHARPGRRRTT